ncbi:hypothetical protein PAALTS15_20603 [Paenibacillus alvei TS-15]|uniref:Uncharacterized protein n=1 Tax=Paenibacillus alvei TS-15 TaxID=1117108 RepID=S9SMM3_PAEAL|nr:hypothetical protein PAALTS15_20603 [Paenibacillus alvei TS-15]
MVLADYRIKNWKLNFNSMWRLFLKTFKQSGQLHWQIAGLTCCNKLTVLYQKAPINGLLSGIPAQLSTFASLLIINLPIL